MAKGTTPVLTADEIIEDASGKKSKKGKSNVIQLSANEKLNSALLNIESKMKLPIYHGATAHLAKVERWDDLVSPDLMYLTGGGVAKGRIYEIYGPESSGKTTISFLIAADIQRAGGTVVYLDLENSYDPMYTQFLGVNIEDLYVIPAETCENTFEIIEALVKSEAIDLIIIDSVDGMVALKELEGDMGDSNMGVKARLMGQGIRKVKGLLAEQKCDLIFINQLRMKLGQMMGNPETTPGGNALKFYASARWDVRRAGVVGKQDDGSSTGYKVKVKVVKSKISPQYRVAEFDFDYKTGFDWGPSYVFYGVKYGIIDKAGSWYTYGDVKAQGDSKLLPAIAEAGLMDAFKRDVRQAIMQDTRAFVLSEETEEAVPEDVAALMTEE